MVNNLLYGISTALKAKFEYFPVYADAVEQGLSEPCFFVLPISSSEQKLLDRRAFRDVSFDVHFISHEKREKLEVIASELYPLLRRITLLDGSQVNGLDLHHEIIDGVLHFFVRFKVVIKYPAESVDMQEILQQVLGVKDEKESNWAAI